VIAGVN
jgi:hypothetical protein